MNWSLSRGWSQFRVSSEQQIIFMYILDKLEKRARSKPSSCTVIVGEIYTAICFNPTTSVSPVNTTPSLLHSHLHQHVVLPEGQAGRSLGNFK